MSNHPEFSAHVKIPRPLPDCNTNRHTISFLHYIDEKQHIKQLKLTREAWDFFGVRPRGNIRPSELSLICKKNIHVKKIIKKRKLNNYIKYSISRESHVTGECEHNTWESCLPSVILWVSDCTSPSTTVSLLSNCSWNKIMQVTRIHWEMSTTNFAQQKHTSWISNLREVKALNSPFLVGVIMPHGYRFGLYTGVLHFVGVALTCKKTNQNKHIQ